MRRPIVFTLLLLFTCTVRASAQQFTLGTLKTSPAITNGYAHSFVSYPQSPQQTPVGIVIHKSRSLVGWVHNVTNQRINAILPRPSA